MKIGNNDLEGYSIEEDLEETMQCLKKANEEIERLNTELDKTRLSELHKEYVINELEKYVRKRIELCYEVGCTQEEFDIWNNIEMKICELKENV